MAPNIDTEKLPRELPNVGFLKKFASVREISAPVKTQWATDAVAISCAVGAAFKNAASIEYESITMYVPCVPVKHDRRCTEHLNV